MPATPHQKSDVFQRSFSASYFAQHVSLAAPPHAASRHEPHKGSYYPQMHRKLAAVCYETPQYLQGVPSASRTCAMPARFDYPALPGLHLVMAAGRVPTTSRHTCSANTHNDKSLAICTFQVRAPGMLVCALPLVGCSSRPLRRKESMNGSTIGLRDNQHRAIKVESSSKAT